jgi:hypothetical protein
MSEVRFFVATPRSASQIALLIPIRKDLYSTELQGFAAWTALLETLPATGSST